MWTLHCATSVATPKWTRAWGSCLSSHRNAQDLRAISSTKEANSDFNKSTGNSQILISIHSQQIWFFRMCFRMNNSKIVMEIPSIRRQTSLTGASRVRAIKSQLANLSREVARSALLARLSKLKFNNPHNSIQDSSPHNGSIESQDKVTPTWIMLVTSLTILISKMRTKPKWWLSNTNNCLWWSSNSKQVRWMPKN